MMSRAILILLACGSLCDVGSLKDDAASQEREVTLIVCKRQTLPESDPFADRVVSCKIELGGGFGQEGLPMVVLGTPRGGGKLQAGTDVLSLGKGGTITLEFVDNEVFDGPGADLLVFENAFLVAPGDDPDFGFFELAKVEVSEDGKEWKEFPYDLQTRKGCAGHHPVYANPDTPEGRDIDPTNAEKAGGDPFDLADVGLTAARFIRITDLDNGSGDNGTAGFDLDAVSAAHSRPRSEARAGVSAGWQLDQVLNYIDVRHAGTWVINGR
jgi:hypothetical protein